MSVAETTSRARPASPCPTWAPNISPPTWFMIAPMPPGGSIAPSAPIASPMPANCSFCSCSLGSADDIAATTRSATGSHSDCHTGRVLSSHSSRVHDSIVCTPEGSSVASSSHRSASRTASASRPVVGG